MGNWITASLVGEHDTDIEDYEFHRHADESEFRAVRPYGERVIATFPDYEAASNAWSLMMEALAFFGWWGRESDRKLFY